MGSSTGHESLHIKHIPCEFHGFIYLCGNYSNTIQVFFPHTDDFLPLQITLHEGLEAELMYVHNDLLVLRSEKHVVKFEVEQSGQLIQFSEAEAPKLPHVYWNPQYVVARGLLFVIDDSKYACFNLDTGKRISF